MPGSYLVRWEGGGGAFAALRWHRSRQDRGGGHEPWVGGEAGCGVGSRANRRRLQPARCVRGVGSQAGVRAWIAGGESQPGGCRCEGADEIADLRPRRPVVGRVARWHDAACGTGQARRRSAPRGAVAVDPARTAPRRPAASARHPGERSVPARTRRERSARPGSGRCRGGRSWDEAQGPGLTAQAPAARLTT